MASAKVEAAPGEATPAVADDDANGAASATVLGKRKADEPPIDLPICVRRILGEMRRMRKIDQRKEWNMEFEVVDEKNIREWRWKWYYENASDADATETVKRLAKQLKNRGLDFIELRMLFPEDFPSKV